MNAFQLTPAQIASVLATDTYLSNAIYARHQEKISIELEDTEMLLSDDARRAWENYGLPSYASFRKNEVYKHRVPGVQIGYEGYLSGSYVTAYITDEAKQKREEEFARFIEMGDNSW